MGLCRISWHLRIELFMDIVVDLCFVLIRFMFSNAWKDPIGSL